MNKILFQLFLITLVICSIDSIAQNEYYNDEPKDPFQPMISFGTGSYLFQGDIEGPKKNFLMGNQGYHFGVKMNLNNNTDLTFLMSNGKVNEINDIDTTSFNSIIKTAGVGLRYSFNNLMDKSRLTPFVSFGAELLTFKRDGIQETESSIAIPLGAGIMLNVSERIGLDMGINYHYTLTDMIDGVEEGGSDNLLVTTFTIHYDLFTTRPKKNRPYSDQRFYAEVNYKALDIEDSDNDLVPDIEDYCPQTPKGVKVDANGCPLDDDKDGIPNYIDDEANTPRGSIVDEKGVQLTDDKSKSMYSKFNAASREYANYYNDSEISKDDFKSINDYLIAKANAFNIANDIPSVNDKLQGKRYAIMLGKYKDEVPANMINKYLSYDDLESLMQDDGMIVYSVGSYSTIDAAIDRQIRLELNEGLADTYIVEIEKGLVSLYAPELPQKIEEDSIIVTEKEEVIKKDVNVNQNLEEDNLSTKPILEIETKKVKKDVIFRVQIGAYKVVLSNDIFKGVPNVVSFTSNDGYTRYFTGSFSSYKDAVRHQNDMLIRGFEGSFVVAFKDGKKVGLYSAIRATNGKLPSRSPVKKNTKKIKEEIKLDLQFSVQIGVYKENVSADILSKMAIIGNINKENINGSLLYRYNAGVYNNYFDAESRLKEVKGLGFDDAFVRSLLDGKQISIDEAKKLSK